MLLEQLRLEVFKDCPKVCAHCYQAQSDSHADKPSPLFLDTPLYQKLIDDFVKQGGYSISITGGEFLLPERSGFSFSFLKYLVDKGVSEIRINSILSYATGDMLEELSGIKIPNLIIQTGIDGETIHDYLRFPGSMEKTLENIRRLQSLGLDNITLRSTIFFGIQVGEKVLDNQADMANILRLCSQNNIKRMKTKIVHNTGETRKEGGVFNDILRQKMDTSIQKTLLSMVHTKESENIETKLLFTKPLPAGFYKYALEKMQTDPGGYKVDSCNCGSKHVSIDGDANVYRCLYNFGKPAVSLGNLLENDLFTILRDRSRFSYALKERKNGGYHGCSSFDENLKVSGR